MTLPEPEGQVVSRQEKVYVPVEEHPEVSLNPQLCFEFNWFSFEYLMNISLVFDIIYSFLAFDWN